MKPKFLFFLALSAVLSVSCEKNDIKSSPSIQVLYKPVKINDGTQLLLKKVNAKTIALDSIRVGDTLSIQVNFYDLNNKLKSVSFVTGEDNSTVFMPDKDFSSKLSGAAAENGGEFTFSKKTGEEAVSILYIAKKSSKTAGLKVYLKSNSKDAAYATDSLKINTPVKFL